MSNPEPERLEPAARTGERRRRDRRQQDRRGRERRTPPPFGRRPAAYVGYGVIATIAVIGVVRSLPGEAERPTIEAYRVEPPQVDGSVPAAQPRDAFTIAQFEGLVAEGDEAIGLVVRAELFCGPIASVNLRSGQPANEALDTIADGDGRVAGAECRWTRESRSSDVLVVVPAQLAEDFARAPEEELNFVRRRRIEAEIEWLGRSEALSLRQAGVLRQIVR